jgi:hypothetical protein
VSGVAGAAAARSIPDNAITIRRSMSVLQKLSFTV